MKKLSYLILTIVVLILIVLFTLQNTISVNIHVLFWNVQTSLALLIFSLGAIASIFILTPTIIALKSSLKK
ncbi:MAG: putative integral membrane protein [Chitinophagales bacterium]|jgi:uncharacterized integral membrane protein